MVPDVTCNLSCTTSACLAACGAIGHFPVGVPANGNEMTCMPRSVGGAKVEVVGALVPEKVDEALTRA